MNIDRTQAHRWRILPKISYTNFRKEYPNMGGCFKKWFNIQRFWGGKIIYINIKHHQLSFDFRKNWLVDMCCYR